MVETVEEQLVEFGIEIEKHGGSVPCVPISIHNNQTLNLSELIETIDCQSELLQPLCDPKARTEGVVIEANTAPLSNEKVASLLACIHEYSYTKILSKILESTRYSI